jgi:tripartite motif-containing protein 71
MLNDARYIAADGNGMVYVADYQDGRVQVFDSTGKYVTQWKVGDEKTIIYGMAANHKGEVFISYDNLLVGMDGASGKQLIKVTAPGGGEYGNLFVAPDGSLAATWYEARWGIITSLQGHRDDLIIFNPEGKAALTIPSFISGQTDDVALDTQVAIDGLGNIYGLERGSIFKFSPKGKYMDRFGSSGSQPGQFSSPRAIAIDGQGQVYVADSDKILLFSSEGQYLTDFPTDGVVDAMVIDEKGAIWGILRDKVTRFVLTGK